MTRHDCVAIVRSEQTARIERAVGTVPRSTIEREYRSLADWSAAAWKAADAGMRLPPLTHYFSFGQTG